MEFPSINRKAILLRYSSDDQGTLGILATEDFFCYTLELPWRDNLPNVSCVPVGEYEVELRRSPKFGNVYWIKNIPGRSFILQHSGNLAGDKDKGYLTQTYGCQLLGQRIGFLEGQKAVLNSRLTVKRFIEYMKGENYKLQIREVSKNA